MNLYKSSLMNFAGGILPALAALFTVPVIVSRLGPDSYGVFALVTAIVGYFAVLDVNLTAGSVKFVSQYHATKEDDKLSQAVVFGCFAYLLIGLIGGVGLFVFAEVLIEKIFNIPKHLHDEAVTALQVAAVAFLVGQVQVYLQSVLQALRRYDISGKLEATFGTLASLATVVTVLVGGGLVEIIATRLCISLINVFGQILVVRRLLPQISIRRPSKQVVQDMASFSAFAYLSRLASISATNSDKLLIGAVADMKALAFYSVPFMLANRVFGLIYRLGQVVFPFASALSATRDFLELERVYLDATRYIIFLNSAICIVLVAFTPEFLHYWAGDVFGSDAKFVLVVVAIAIFIDSLTNIPSLINDGMGKPHITGIAAISRAALSVAAVYLALEYAGIRGAAVAQLFTSIMATGVFLLAVHRWTIRTPLVKVVMYSYRPAIFILLLAVVLAPFSISRAPIPIWEFFGGLAFLGLALIVYAWFFVVGIEHRMKIIGVVNSFSMRRLGAEDAKK